MILSIELLNTLQYIVEFQLFRECYISVKFIK